MTKPEMIATATRIADTVVESVIEEIRDAIQDRRDNAVWWYAFHSYMLSALPRWRWLARRHHRYLRRRMAGAIKANKVLAGACLPFVT